MTRININHSRFNSCRLSKRRKGAALILALFLLSVLISMLALSIDIGYMAASKSEARRAVDAAALAGYWQIFESSKINQNETMLQTGVQSAANSIAGLNLVCNNSPLLSTSSTNSDISIGYLASLNGSSPILSSSNNPYRAVRVTLRKTESFNGQVPLFFANFFGQSGRNMTVEATAAMAWQVKGFSSPSSYEAANLGILPFAVDENTWNAMLNGGGTDSYKHDFDRSIVSSGSDGIREVNLYPQGTGSPGNRGTVDIGGANNSTADLARQIVYGISAQDFTELGKPLVLDSNGTLTLNGDTGISAGVKDELASIIGQTRIIPVFSSVSGNGNNAMFTIVRWVGVRILAVKLTGAMNSKFLMVQPAPVLARNVIPGDTSRTWSSTIYSPVVLVK